MTVLPPPGRQLCHQTEQDVGEGDFLQKFLSLHLPICLPTHRCCTHQAPRLRLSPIPETCLFLNSSGSSVEPHSTCRDKDESRRACLRGGAVGKAGGEKLDTASEGAGIARTYPPRCGSW